MDFMTSPSGRSAGRGTLYETDQADLLDVFERDRRVRVYIDVGGMSGPYLEIDDVHYYENGVKGQPSIILVAHPERTAEIQKDMMLRCRRSCQPSCRCRSWCYASSLAFSISFSFDGRSSVLRSRGRNRSICWVSGASMAIRLCSAALARSIAGERLRNSEARVEIHDKLVAKLEIVDGMLRLILPSDVMLLKQAFSGAAGQHYRIVPTR